jgi:hypothetical protein
MKKMYSFLAALALVPTIAFSQVTQQWANTYAAPTNTDDIAFAMVLDGSGNSYVTGASFNGVNYDIVTIKYNGLGTQQWLSTYNSPGNGSDLPSAMAIDASGNIYVTGVAFNGTDNDFATVAYDNNGNELWSDVVNGPGNGNDIANAIAVNASGEVFVTGGATVGSGFDYFTIKYNNAGAQQWTAAFDGAGNSLDLAMKVGVDGSGNVYVSGNSVNGINYDFATVKYDNTGAEQWAAVYNGTGNADDYLSGMHVDASGNVYVGGTSMLVTQDYVAVKYDNAGNELFVANYSETASSSQQAYAIELDAAGNIYMTGRSTDGGVSSNATVKFNSSGVQQWSALYAGGPGGDYGSVLTVDASGNVFVAGVTTTAFESDNISTIKYNSSGAQQWVRFYNGTDNTTDAPVAIAVDASENVYVTGQVMNTGTSMDYVTIKYVLSSSLSATSSQTDLNCNAICDGTASVVASGGVTPYTYSWTSGGTSDTETGLCAGNYTCTITDANADFIEVTFTLTAPTALSSVNAHTNISCFGGANGTATVNVSGGTGVYTYDWSGAPTGEGTNAVTGLTAGNYTCTITDANGCILTETFAITQPAVLNGVKSQTNVTCFGGSNATATIAPTGGTAPFTYVWTPFGGNAATATSLVAGVYTVTITDANGCTVPKFYNITQPSPVSSTPGQTDVTCNGNADGTATVIAFGGVGPYTYAWAPTGGTAATETGLAAGNYTCTITDASGCTFDQMFFITEPAILSDVASQSDLTCNGNASGSITVNISGGTAPYSYSWAPNGETTATISSLTAGTYTCTTTDANGCILVETFILAEPATLTAIASQTDNSCNGGNTGSASVAVSGGTPAYAYAWMPTGGNAATASSLIAGNYTCTITDANACVLTETFTITEPAGMSATSSQTEVSCAGGTNGTASVVVSGGVPAYTYAWTSGGTAATETGLSAGNYTCTITDASACTLEVTFTITEPTPLSSINAQTNISCNGGTGDASVTVSGGTGLYTYAWAPSGGNAATTSSLTAGNYTCTITDANGCMLTETVAITEPAALSSVNTQTDLSCNGMNTGNATVMVSGGVSPYTYAWAPSGGSAATASSLTAGSYTCAITDANGCTLSETFIITEPAALTSTNMQTNISCNGGNTGDAMVMISGGTPAYSYVWSPSGGFAATASGLTAGTYTCLITDANSCTLTETFNITEPSAITAMQTQTDITCNGTNDGTATVVASGGAPAYTYAWLPSGGNAATASSLAAGNYTCTITDANGCSTTATFVITEPATLLATSTQTNINCNGANTGDATVSVIGGTPAYSYAWAPSGGSAATASSLTAGNYTCTVTDANGCTTTATVNITEPTAITTSTTQSDISCNGNTNGSASVLAIGGTPGYSYFWLPSGGTSSTASSLATGTYTCTVTDANGCTANATVTITEPAALVTTNSQADVTCNGAADGTATVVVSGGTPAYNYSWFPTGGFAATATGLSAGSYTCTITDANSCSTTATFTIAEPTVIAATASQTDITCNGASDGTATVIASGGTPAYTYAWMPTGGTAATASGLAAGNYTCTITDANGCATTATFNITEPAGIILAGAGQTNVNCFGGNDGAASVTASGGAGGFIYDWTPGTPTGDGTASVTGLTAGTWTCTVTDANGCTATQTFAITEAPAMTVVSSQTNTSCNGGTNGTATVVVSGGTPVYTYAWMPAGGTAATASGLSAGTYTCTITDAGTCVITATFNITEPAAITSVNTQTNVSCFGGSNASATVVVSGGAPAYTYAWAPTGGTAATASGLIAGTYTCTITDANGCISTQTFALTEPAMLSAVNMQSNVSCSGGNNGTATVTVSGGTPAYTYAWSPSGGTGATASGLIARTYTCTITDANTCSTTATFTITEAPAFVVTAAQTNVSCFGGNNGSATVTVSGATPAYTYTWMPTGGTAATAPGLTAGSYTCTITDAASCTFSQTFSITEPPAMTIVNSQTNISCNGGSNGTATVVVSGGTPAYTYAWAPTGGNTASASGLIAGAYTCTITDANGCTATATFNITAPTAITVTSSQTNVSCNGGSNGTATVVVSGGTPVYTYAWMPTGGTAATASGLIAGTYTCTITDANGCTATATFSLTAPPALATTGTQTNVSCFSGNNGSATVNVTGGTPSYTYAWAPAGGNAATATGLTAQVYTVTITDANGCTTTRTFNITAPPALATTGTQTNVSCFGGNNGSATVNVTGGTPSYTYAWAPAGGNAATATGLTAQVYTVTVTDANGCATTRTFNITAPTPITFTSSQTNVSCNAGNNGSATVVVAGGTPSYTYAWLPSGGTAATATGLTAGNYTCTITDANSCTTTATFNITQPPALTVTSTQTNVSCFGGSNGAATVVVAGGTPAYTYAWAPTGGTGAAATGLAMGTYTCTITDANGCIITRSVNITQPTMLTATTSIVNASCAGGTNGQAAIIVSGGTPAYSYAWLPTGGTTATEFNLAAGTYTCNVTDANGCTLSQTVVITAPTPITTSATQTDVTCFGGTNGSAGVLASGGTPGYTYLWTPGGGTAANANGLSAGSYTCTITDANGCTLAQGFVITQPNMLAAVVTATNVVCQGGADGTALVSVTGGTLNYNFTWSPSGGTDSLATGLAAGTYTCAITDANGCALTATAIIAEPSPINVTPSHTNVTCFGGTNGTATVVVSGGFAPYTYAWSPSGGTASTATGLSAGTHTCVITDAGGCVFTQTVSIASPSAMTATTSQTNVGCNGGSNGSATIIVNGGSPFYSYNWLPSGGTAPVATGLAQGTYTCNVADANGCILSQTFLITEPAVLTGTISSTNTNCGQSNGTATLVASGGTAPYTYSWSPVGGNSATANAILAGTYTCAVTDANGCTASFTVIVNDTPAPTLSLVSQTNILCNGNNTGDVTVLAAGGVGTYTYAWTPSGGTGVTASSLLAGIYTCTVTDSAGCTGTQTVAITEPTVLTATATSGMILCNGDSTTITVVASGGASPYVGEGTFTDTAGTYTYVITDANGCTTSTSITVTEPTILSASATATSILCNGDSAAITVSAAGGTGPYTGTGTFMHAAGTFVYTVTDANGCSITDSITMTEPALLTSSSSATSIMCNGGNTTITVVAAGGTAPYSGDETFTAPAGTFVYTVTDANGCAITDSIAVAEPALLVAAVDSTFDPTGCSGTDGAIYISANGGTAGYTYLWTTSSANEDLTGVAAGTYSCTITDANGCTTMVSATLTDPAPPVVTVSIDTTLCTLDAPYALTEGNPTGGTWSGASVSGNIFDPSIGIGAYVLTYTFTAANGCTASASDTIVVDACSGIEPVTASTSWSAYPNPTYGNITLSANGGENEDQLVEVYSSEGKLIFSERFLAGNLIQLNLVEQAAGVYMVRVISTTEISTVRIIKQ